MAAPLALGGESSKDAQPFFQQRGIVVIPPETEALELPDLCARNGLNLIDVAHYTGWLAEPVGQEFLARCRARNIDVVWGMHAASWALPRDLFAKHPDYFRMTAAGERTAEGNFCVHSEAGLRTAVSRLAELVRANPSTTERYYLWIDDGMPMCRCPQCQPFSDSEQALRFENALVRELRRTRPQAMVAHLAYMHTLAAPVKVKPEAGVFLQFAAIQRDLSRPLGSQDLDSLDANLRAFGAETAEVLDYWLDNARASDWKREKVGKLPWHPEAFRGDLQAYARRGIRHVRSYAVWMDKDYVAKYGPPPYAEYGAGLNRWRLVGGAAVESE